MKIESRETALNARHIPYASRRRKTENGTEKDIFSSGFLLILCFSSELASGR